MKTLSLSAIVFASAGIFGCSTAVEDIQEARSDVREATVEADQLVASVRRDANEQLADIRETVEAEIDASTEDVTEAVKEGADDAKVRDKKADLEAMKRAGAKAISDAKDARKADLVDAKLQGEKLVMDAKKELLETQVAAIKDAKEAVQSAEADIVEREKNLLQRTTEVSVLEKRLKVATSEDREGLQSELDDALAAVAAAERQLAEAKDASQQASKKLNQVASATQ